MTTAQKLLLLMGQFDPYKIGNNAAIYSLAGSPSDSTYIVDGSNRVSLIADRSGNSATNGLILNAASGNYASATNSSALQLTGNLDLRAWIQSANWTPSANQNIISKNSGPTSGGYGFGISVTTGYLAIYWSNGITTTTAQSTAATGFAQYSSAWIRATLQLNSGGVYVATFYTSLDGSNWTQLGNVVNGGAPATVAIGNTPLYCGTFGTPNNDSFAGILFRTQVYNGINGTLVFDADFTRVSKLASSFTESSSNAATVTINTSGDTGARISGARDLVQLTVAKQPIFSTGSDGKNLVTFDGSNDYMRSALFTLVQPFTDYMVASMVAWASGGYLADGSSAANTAGVVMTTSTPQINLNAGSSVAGNTNLAVGIRGVITALFNGVSSILEINQTTPTTGNAGAGTPNGITIGASGASTAANFANMTFSEKWVRSVADSGQIRQRIVQYLLRKWSIAG